MTQAALSLSRTKQLLRDKANRLSNFGRLASVRLGTISGRLPRWAAFLGCAKELNRSRGRFPGESSHEAHWRPA